jgi:molybdate transport system substrate-binding protein
VFTRIQGAAAVVSDGTLPARQARKMNRTGALSCVCLAALSALAACSSSGGSSSSNGQVKGTVVVFAATSLNGAFDKIGSQFEHAHPGVSVTFNYNGSSSLATSITQGAKADVFASADTANMNTVTDAHDAKGEPKVFAKNQLEIMAAKGNPMRITSVSDLSKPSVKVVLCAPSVPCGKYASQVFKKAGVSVSPVSEETSVGGVVTKVTLGEADAGMVYETDIKTNEGKITGVPIPADQNVLAYYPMVELKDASNSPAATSFMNYVNSSAGQSVLASYGFMPASS